MGNGAIYLAVIIFAFMALIHLARILCPFEVMIGGVALPHELSYLGFIIFGLIAIALFRARHCTKELEKNK
jgi:hypothetical protein